MFSASVRCRAQDIGTQNIEISVATGLKICSRATMDMIRRTLSVTTESPTT